MRLPAFTPPRRPDSPIRQRHHISVTGPYRPASISVGLITIPIWLVALILCLPGHLPAQCLVENPSFEIVDTTLLKIPGYKWSPLVESPISGCPGWYSRRGSPDVFWPTNHVPNNFMTQDHPTKLPLEPFHKKHYAGVSTGRFSTTPESFYSEIFAGNLISSPIPGQPYQVHARFAKGSARNNPGFMRVYLDGPSGPRIVGHRLVDSSEWMSFSEVIITAPGTSYDRILIEGMDSLPYGWGAYVFVDSIDMCAVTPCDFVSAKLRKHFNPYGSCCYDLLMTNWTPSALPWPATVRITTQAPVQLYGATVSSTSWSYSTFGTTRVSWHAWYPGAPLPTGTDILAGTFCIDPTGVAPQQLIVEFLTPSNALICRDTIYTDCDAVKQPCIEMFNQQISCETADASGNQRYKISFGANPLTSSFPAGSTLRIRSAQGTFSSSTFSLSTAPTMMTTTFTDTPAKDSTVCIIGDLHIMIGERDSIACSDTLCITLPNCPPGCCTNVTRVIQNPRISYLNGGVTLTGCALAGPGKIKRFSATIVRAYTLGLARPPLFPRPMWVYTRAFGDMISGTLSSTLSGPAYVGPSDGREVVWGGAGSPACADFTPCVPFSLKMAFPDPPSATDFDTLVFSIRYSFTDCECRTCDTTITYKLGRKRTNVTWTTDRTTLTDNGTPNTSLGSLAMPIPGLMRIDMSSDDDGTLSMTLPESDPEAPAIRVIGMRFRPLDVALTEMKQQGVQQPAPISGNAATHEFTLDGGQSALFDLTYSNGEGERVIGNLVRFKYILLSDPQEILETDDILVEGHVPGASGGDVVDEQSGSGIQGVRTYVLHVDADNAAGEPVDAIRVKVDGGSTKLIAVGPVGEGTDVVLTPGTDDDGNSVVQIDRSAWVGQPIAPATSLMPLYLTFAGAANGATIDYETINVNGAVLSGGSVHLGSPLRTAGVGSDVEDGQSALWPLYPNPAGTAATVGFRLHQNGTVKLSVRDLQGREVVTKIANEQMAAGDHLISVATGGLAQGTYIVVLDVDGRTFTRTLTVVR